AAAAAAGSDPRLATPVRQPARPFSSCVLSAPRTPELCPQTSRARAWPRPPLHFSTCPSAVFKSATPLPASSKINVLKSKPPC
ncbi:E3 ubiquitin-protein ligase DZIP3, partial [Frankliniella fusca]